MTETRSATPCCASSPTIAPEADPAAIAPDVDLRDQLDIDSMDFLNFVIALHERARRRHPRARLPEARDARRLRRLRGRRRRRASPRRKSAGTSFPAGRGVLRRTAAWAGCPGVT